MQQLVGINALAVAPTIDGCAFLGVGCVMAILAPDGWENPNVLASRVVAGLTPLPPLHL